mmetsp:Transcript_14149/g.27821  ORF Transcript_14149/g.27821 Transcript_14149/m.27821 type:complete len:270 (-) Transcript_14149:692-1501(-)
MFALEHTQGYRADDVVTRVLGSVATPNSYLRATSLGLSRSRFQVRHGDFLHALCRQTPHPLCQVFHQERRVTVTQKPVSCAICWVDRPHLRIACLRNAHVKLQAVLKVVDVRPNDVVGVDVIDGQVTHQLRGRVLGPRYVTPHACFDGVEHALFLFSQLHLHLSYQLRLGLLKDGEHVRVRCSLRPQLLRDPRHERSDFPVQQVHFGVGENRHLLPTLLVEPFSALRVCPAIASAYRTERSLLERDLVNLVVLITVVDVAGSHVHQLRT